MPEIERAPFDNLNISGLISLIGGLALMLSLAREVGFFWTIDRKLMSFLTVQDIISNSLHIVPYSIFLIGIGIGFAEYNVSLPGQKTAWNIISSKRPIFDMKLGAFFIICFFLFFPDWNAAIFIQLFLFYVAAISWLKTRLDLPHRKQIADLFFIMFLVFQSFVLGAIEARSALKRENYNYEIIKNNGDAFEASLLKSGQTFFMIRTDSNSIRILDRTDIDEIRRTNVGKPGAIIPLFKWISDFWTFLMSYF